MICFDGKTDPDSKAGDSWPTEQYVDWSNCEPVGWAGTMVVEKLRSLSPNN